MNRTRAFILAVSASAGLAFAWSAWRAGVQPPSPIDRSFQRIDASAPVAASGPGAPDPVPEPAALGLFGIGISTLITFRRLRKLLY